MTVRISAAVCTFNRAGFLFQCLDSLVKQNYADYEVIVVDDGSTDGTAEKISQYQQRLPPSLIFRYIRHQRNCGLGAARNTAVRNCDGEIIAFTDDDCIVSPDWIATIAECHAKHPDVAAVGGPVLNGYKDSIIASVGQQMVTYQLHAKLMDRQYTSFLVGNNQSYKKNAIEKVGYFEEKFRYGGEEGEIQRRLLRSGAKIMFWPTVTVTHFQRSSLKSFLKQYYTYGINLYISASKYGGIGLDRDKPPNVVGILARVLKKPYRVGRYLEKPLEKALCYPLVYLAWGARTLGFIVAKLSFVWHQGRL